MYRTLERSEVAVDDESVLVVAKVGDTVTDAGLVVDELPEAGLKAEFI